MKSAPPGENEADHLAARYRHRVLDTPDGPQSDEVTPRAAQLGALPMALLSLVDASRQGTGLYSPPGAGFYLGLLPAGAKQRAAGAVA